MMADDREAQLRARLVDLLGEDRVSFAKQTPNNAGVYFGRLRERGLLVAAVHPGQVVAMSEAFSDDVYPAFVDVLALWASHVLDALALDVDVATAIEAAQHSVAASHPEEYELLNLAFDL